MLECEIDALARAHRDEVRIRASWLAVAFHEPAKLSEAQDEAEEDAQGLTQLMRWGSAMKGQLQEE